MGPREIQALIIVIVILLIMTAWQGYSRDLAVVGVGIGIAAIAIIEITPIDRSESLLKAGGNGSAASELEESTGSKPDTTDFEAALGEQLQRKRTARRKHQADVHAHQEACREVMMSMLGVPLYELSGSTPLPRGEHVVPTEDHLSYWHRGDPGKPVYLDLDGWNGDLNLAFEYRGPIHDTDPDVRKNDSIKERLAQAHGLRLMILHYGIPAESMSRYIYTQLQDWKIPMRHGMPRFASLSSERMRELDWHNPKRIDCTAELRKGTKNTAGNSKTKESK